MSTEQLSRICRSCGYCHPYRTPVYRCAVCFKWGQDFYELPPIADPSEPRRP